jgi:hypothetical protein
MTRKLALAFGVIGITGVLCVWSFGAPLGLTSVEVYPKKDGTIADGGIHGDLDGEPDAADWNFFGTGFQGAITLTNSLEQRLVWEYDLSTLGFAPPVSASLTFTLRGAPRWPVTDVDVQIYSYPADLLERFDDFYSEPAVLEDFVTTTSYQDPTEYVITVTEAVNEALQSGVNKVAFRFQVDPETPNAVNQAFLDADDAEPSTKPFITIEDRVPGDVTDDGLVDLLDYSPFYTCMQGPGTAREGICVAFDLNYDGDVDLADLKIFHLYFLSN